MNFQKPIKKGACGKIPQPLFKNEKGDCEPVWLTVPSVYFYPSSRARTVWHTSPSRFCATSTMNSFLRQICSTCVPTPLRFIPNKRFLSNRHSTHVSTDFFARREPIFSGFSQEGHSIQRRGKSLATSVSAGVTTIRSVNEPRSPDICRSSCAASAGMNISTNLRNSPIITRPSRGQRSA